MPAVAGVLISLKTSTDKLVSTEGKCKENRIPLNARRRELLEKLIVAHIVTKLSPVWNPELYCRVCKMPSRGRILSRLNPLRIFTLRFKICFKMFLFLRPVLTRSIYPSGFTSKIFYAFRLSSMYRPTNEINYSYHLLYFINIIIFGGDYNLCSSSPYNLLCRLFLPVSWVQQLLCNASINR
jgi:hypothetical protein